MRPQLENDLCDHLRMRLRRAVKDHQDTCARIGIDEDTAFDMAIAVVIAESLTLMKEDGGTPDDVMQVIAFVQQKALSL